MRALFIGVVAGCSDERSQEVKSSCVLRECESRNAIPTDTLHSLSAMARDGFAIGSTLLFGFAKSRCICSIAAHTGGICRDCNYRKIQIKTPSPGRRWIHGGAAGIGHPRQPTRPYRTRIQFRLSLSNKKPTTRVSFLFCWWRRRELNPRPQALYR